MAVLARRLDDVPMGYPLKGLDRVQQRDNMRQLVERRSLGLKGGDPGSMLRAHTFAAKEA